MNKRKISLKDTFYDLNDDIKMTIMILRPAFGMLNLVC